MHAAETNTFLEFLHDLLASPRVDTIANVGLLREVCYNLVRIHDLPKGVLFPALDRIFPRTKKEEQEQTQEFGNYLHKTML